MNTYYLKLTRWQMYLLWATLDIKAEDAELGGTFDDGMLEANPVAGRVKPYLTGGYTPAEIRAVADEARRSLGNLPEIESMFVKGDK